MELSLGLRDHISGFGLSVSVLSSGVADISP